MDVVAISDPMPKIGLEPTTHAIESGRIQIKPAARSVPGHSYGGFKRSGIGREYSLEGMLDSFTQRKSVTANLQF
ncbi:MAG TPA: aldehyde dehydrogenase family protein [Vicinamibacterales bacterium]|nr:aldehyde dehydrogenase family protein [Vicinamibacterales bacterium]